MHIIVDFVTPIQQSYVQVSLSTRTDFNHFALIFAITLVNDDH